MSVEEQAGPMGGAAGGQVEFDEVRLARMAWARLLEPAAETRLAQAVRAMGPVAALEWLRAGSAGQAGRAVQARLEVLDLEREVRATRACGARVLVPGDEEWPSGLDDLELPPHCLWVRGPVSLGSVVERSVALVGSRAATSYGEHVAGELAYGLAGRGFSVVSGAAFGIDAAAHRGALAAEGLTVGVLACGVDRPYPVAHRRLIGELAERGLVVSEVPPGGAPMRQRFLARNRLIAAMTSGTVVVEAGLRSGALNTVRWALECGRMVGAVPGPVTSVASAGVHQLLRSHRAELVTDAEEVAELCGAMGQDLAPVQRGESRPTDALDLVEAQVYDAMPKVASVSVENLCRSAGLEHDVVLRTLASLELLGMAEHHGDAWRRGRVGI